MPNDPARLLRQRGIQVTAQRLAVLRAVSADPHITADSVAEAVRAEAASLIPEIEAGNWPFDGSLVSWRPDPLWPVPPMPESWNEDFSR